MPIYTLILNVLVVFFFNYHDAPSMRARVVVFAVVVAVAVILFLLKKQNCISFGKEDKLLVVSLRGRTPMKCH